MLYYNYNKLDTHLHNHNITEAASLVREDVTFVRPTGNPLNKEQWDSMMNNDDVTVDSNKLISINKLIIILSLLCNFEEELEYIYILIIN